MRGRSWAHRKVKKERKKERKGEGGRG